MRDKNARCEIGRDEPAFAISNLIARDFSAFRRWQTDQKRLLIILAYKLRGSLLSSVVCVRPSGYGKMELPALIGMYSCCMSFSLDELRGCYSSQVLFWQSSEKKLENGKVCHTLPRIFVSHLAFFISHLAFNLASRIFNLASRIFISHLPPEIVFFSY